ncbi:MAG: HEAT repeat domain-containing protein [Desulfuromonadales bacterium]|nr:HEAT repeat domain-containing protein [Desulfuromonadales bacterium]
MVADTLKKSGVIKSFLKSLIVLQSHLRLYGPGNPNVDQTSARLLSQLAHLFATQRAITLVVVKDGFVFEDAFLDRPNKNLEAFANRLFQQGIAALTWEAGVNAEEMVTFLQLVGRKPSETWKEGGMENSLSLRQVHRIRIQEMAEKDFLLTEGTTQDREEQPPDDLWGSFALALSLGFPLGVAEGADAGSGSPADLARVANGCLGGGDEGERSGFLREAAEALLALRHEKKRLLRQQALRSVAQFANELSPELRQLFLRNAFNVGLDAELVENLILGLSDQALLEALQMVTQSEAYAPPMVMQLLGKLAEQRGPGVLGSVHGPSPRENSDTFSQLLRPDDVAQYVPEPYQEALLRIIETRSLPPQALENLDDLKQSLAPARVKAHLGRVLLEILQQGPDPAHLTGVCGQLVMMLHFYLGDDDFQKTGELCRFVLEGDEHYGELRRYIFSSNFTHAVLDRVGYLEREKLEEVLVLISDLRAPFISPLLDRLSTETNRGARVFYLRCLKEIGEDCLPEALRRLGDNRWFVTRNMIYLLREIGNPTVLPQLRACLGHSHPKTHQEALKACLFFGDPAALGHLQQALAGKDKAEVMAAIHLATQTSDPAVTSRLLQLVKSSSLFDFRLEIRKTAVRALAVHTPIKALPVFAALLASRTVVHRQPLEALKLEIISTLGHYPAGESTPILLPLVTATSEPVSRLAAATMKKLTGELR